MSDLLYVDGGNPLSGDITVRGAKNFVSKAMVAALLGETPSVLRNVPQIRDVAVVTGLLELHGVKVDADAEAGTLHLDPTDVESAHVADIDTHAGSSRIPILFCGPLLHRLGEAFIPDLGGCRIGDRPINYHLDILRQFGAVVDKTDNGIHIRAPRPAAGHQDRAAVPERRRHRAAPAHGGARRGHHRAGQRRDRARDHGPHQRPAEDGRDHLRRHRPGDPHRGRRPARRLPAHGALRPDRGRVLGRGGAGHRRRRVRARGHAARDDDVPQHVPQGRRRVRRRRRGHPVLPPRRRPALDPAGDRRPPRAS